MGKVSGNWVTGAHSGRACKHENIYTKVNKKTGACYTAKLCNPNTFSNSTQIKTQHAFAMVSKAVSAWVKTNKEANSELYKKAKQMYDHQSKYSTIRGMIIGKGMYTYDGSSTVTVDLDARTNFNTAFGIKSGTGNNGSNGSAGGTIAGQEQIGNNQGTGTPTDNNGESTPGFGDY